MVYLFLVIGLIILVKGADYLIDGASSLARRFKISSLVVGLTVVALGTSLPELVISFFSASSGVSDIALGNVIGSNIANILLVMGIAAMIMPLKIAHSTIWREIPLSLGAILLLFILTNLSWVGEINTRLTTIDGILLLGLFVYYTYHLWRTISADRASLDEGPKSIDALGLGKTFSFILIGIIGLIIGGQLTVDSTVTIARAFGVSDLLISTTIIAVGTSAPELITSGRAAMHKNSDLAVGNIIGSNIINILLVLGLTSTVWGVSLPRGINFDMIFLILASTLLLSFLFIGRKHELKRWQGLTFILSYIGYLFLIIKRG